MRTQIGQPVQFLWGFGIASRAYRVTSQGDFDSCNSEFPKLSRFPASSAFTSALTSSLTSALTCRHGQVARGLGICRSQFGDLCLPPGLWFGDHHSGPAAATCDMTAVTSCAQTASTSSTDPCQISSATIECYSSCCTYAEAQTALDAAVSAAAAIPNCNLVSPCA